MTDSIWTILGAWSLGVVVVFLVCSLFAKAVYAGVEFVENLHYDVQERLGSFLFMAFSAALLYLIVWGCYILGDALLKAIAG